MACESLVSQVQHPSNQALKQAVTTNCQLSKVIPLHLTIALAAASACTHARRQVCLRKRVQKKPACDTGTHIASVQLVQRDTVCCAGRGTLHTCMYTLLTVPARADQAVDEPKSANWQRIAAIVTGRLIFTLSWPRAALLHIHVCVCACHNRKSKLFPPACSFNKDRLVCENVAECPTLGGCYDNHKSLETRKQTARLLRGS